MQSKYYFLWCWLLALALVGCQPKNNKAEGETSQAKAERFANFALLFPDETKTLPTTFGEEWLDRQISPAKIDSAACQAFIYGNLVLNHQLLINGADEKDIELDKTKSYYMVCKIPLSQNFVSLIISDLEKDATSTYLMNYTPQGDFVSGVLIQGRYFVKDGQTTNKITRESVVSDSQMILCQEKLVGRNKFINYDVAANGKIVHRQ